MGTTFTNLQIKTGGQELTGLALSAEFMAVRTAQEWYTIYETDGSHDFRRMHKLGCKLSEIVSFPVLVVYYFDDDRFEFYLMKAGKVISTYRLSERQILSQKVPAFVTEMGLVGKEATALRYLMKQEMSIQASIDAFSRLLGTKLYTDWGWETDFDNLWQKDAESVIAAMEAEKKTTKVKNKAELILREEISGMVVQDGDDREAFEDKKARIYRVAPFACDRDASRIVCYQEHNGSFQKVHEYQYPEDLFPKEALQATMDFEHKIIMLWMDDGDCCYIDELDWNQYKETFAKQRRVPEEQKEKSEAMQNLCSLYGRSSVSGQFEYFYFGQGVIYKVDWKQSESCAYQDNVVKKYIYESAGNTGWWSDFFVPPVVIGDKILMVRYLFRYPGTGEQNGLDIRFFDKDLNILRKEFIPVNLDVNSSWKHYAYNEERDLLYLGEEKVDLQAGEVISCSLKLDRALVLGGLDAKQNVYMVKGHALYIFSPDMKLLSQHKFKGETMDFYVNGKGNMCLITKNDFVEGFSKVKENFALRLYEVVWKDEN